MRLRTKPFQVGQMAEYGHFGDVALGGHWYGCEVVEVAPVFSIRAKNTNGEWLAPFALMGHRVRHVPARPYCIRRRHAAPRGKHNTRLSFTYFVSVSKIFPATCVGDISEAYRFATEKEAKAALVKLRAMSAGDWIAISLETAERDEAALVQEAT